jgi:type II secretory pathway component PulM
MKLQEHIHVPPAWIHAWDRLSPREHGLAFAALAVVLIAAGWSWAWQPMQEDTARARREVLRDRAALGLAREQATEIAGLQRTAQSSPGGDPRLAIERVLAERSLKTSVTSLEVKDNRTYVTFAAIGFDALVGTLDALAKSDGLRPMEATLTSRVEPGTVRAEITLAR